LFVYKLFDRSPFFIAKRSAKRICGYVKEVMPGEHLSDHPFNASICANKLM